MFAELYCQGRAVNMTVGLALEEKMSTFFFFFSGLTAWLVGS